MDHLSQYNAWQDGEDWEHEHEIRMQHAEADYEEAETKLEVLYDLADDGENVASEIEEWQEKLRRAHAILSVYD